MIPKKEFYFVRHGQTDHNIGKVVEEGVDLSLNATGRVQAQGIEPLIATLPVKTVCHSPLKRVVETKKIITARMEAPYVEISHLSECSTPTWFQMTSLNEKAYTHGPQEVISFMDRVKQGMHEALSQPGPILVVAHGGVHWALCYWMQVEHEWMVGNCVPIHFYLEEGGQWKAKRLV